MIKNYFNSLHVLVCMKDFKSLHLIHFLKLSVVLLFLINSSLSFSQRNSEEPVPFINSTFGNLTAVSSEIEFVHCVPQVILQIL